MPRALTRVRRGLGLSVVLGLVGCFVSSCPATRRTGLVAAADSVAHAVRSLECNGPYDCFGIMAGDTVGWYHVDHAGRVEVVGREWRVQDGGKGREPGATYSRIAEGLTRRYGPAVPCARKRDGIERWRWQDGERTFALAFARRLDSETKYTFWLVQGLDGLARCGKSLTPPRFL